MKIKCPNCQTDLRYIASSKLFLCNDCGYHIEGEQDPEPVKVQATPAIAAPHSSPNTEKVTVVQYVTLFAYLASFIFAVFITGRVMSEYQKSMAENQIRRALITDSINSAVENFRKSRESRNR